MTGVQTCALPILKADLVARLTPLAPLLIRAGGAALGVVLALALLFAAGVLRFVPADEPRARPQLILGRRGSRDYTVRPDERRAHMTVVGLSGMGKSKAVASWVAQDILREREAALVLDIHQSLIDDVLALVGDRVRAQRGLVLEVGHPRWAYGFDPLWCFPGDRPELRATAAARAW